MEHIAACLKDQQQGSSSHHVLVVGSNAALQKTIWMENFTPGAVNRASKVRYGMGGKGQLVARAMNNISPQSSTVIQFLAGQSGKQILQIQKELHLQNVTIECDGETRTATTIIDLSKDAKFPETEVIDPSSPIESKLADEFVNQFKNHLERKSKERRWIGVAISGTFPPGCEMLYERLCKVAGSCACNPLHILMDGYKGVDGALRSGYVDVLKVNLSEIFLLSGIPKPSSHGSELISQLFKSVQKIKEKYPYVKICGITDGAKHAYLWHFPDRGDHQPNAWRFKLVAVTANNCIGCGDSVTAGFLTGLTLKMECQDAFQFGLAAGSAAATSEAPADFILSDALELFPQITCEKLVAPS